MSIPTDAAYAARLDAADPLAHFRAAFADDDPGLIYLDGNSLGRLPLRAAELADDLVRRQWGGRLIRGWNEGWFEAPERVGAKIARLIGAHPDEVIVADSTSVNLFKLAVGALRARPDRASIVSDDMNFPSDLYVLQGAAELLGDHYRLEVVPSPDGVHGPVEAILDRLDGAALLSLSHTAFKSGYVYDMAPLCGAARAAGALTLWDLSHSVGAVPIDLEAAGADLAVGCTYKYLNGGPGAPAFLYVRRELQERIANPIAGWMGRRDLFGFELSYSPAPGIRRFLTGTPPVVSLSLIEPGLDLLLEAGIERLRAKSLAQGDYLIALWAEILAPLGFTLKSPQGAERRGSHVSLGHPEALGIDLALIRELKVLPDFRAPDNLRLGIAPIYNSYADIHEGVARLARVVREGLHTKYMAEAPTVT
ncbi:MAG TPA: aminotransferase class V-fold PLP-dependent enzyme [Chloroflexaceae bacterium]|nr:aminotransferase class V-fold PLP-dependent enzyme [Chloroflexaceae bacterium]